MHRGPEITKNSKILAVTATATAVLDQVTKLLVTRGLAPYEGIEVIPGFFNLVHYLNQGAAFGILNDGGLLGKLFLIGVSLASLVIIAVLVRRSGNRLTTIAFSLIAGGAAGNLIDRVRSGSVVDFLDFHVYSYHWPAFNVADSAITTGVGLALFSYIFAKDGPQAKGL